ncbi:hypothetical protein [Bradyrhizobium genosp. P]|uniref:hypothetical protein n=1 Tax=Bradyrhizobium genosp. P TaxID=83641 RepID=UPI003CEAC007
MAAPIADAARRSRLEIMIVLSNGVRVADGGFLSLQARRAPERTKPETTSDFPECTTAFCALRYKRVTRCDPAFSKELSEQGHN